MRALELVGLRFGKLVVIERSANNKSGKSAWTCSCDCGAMTTVAGVYLVKGMTRSCGCLRGGNINRLEGRRFGRWLVLERGSSNSYSTTNWLCRCDCGAERLVSARNLTSGGSTSCGCYNRDVTTKHGFCSRVNGRSPEYMTWQAMLDRCRNENHLSYANYGGRGITVCDEWKDDFLAFLEDMGPKPSRSHSIERIDNDRGYEPSNCRWATQTEQRRNTRTNLFVEINGVTRCMMEWSLISGIGYDTLHARHERGDMGEHLLRPSRELKKYPRDSLEIDGVIRTQKEWADISGVPYYTIRYRRNCGLRGRDLIKPVKK